MARPGISTKNTGKKPPRAKILELQENTPKTPKKNPKICAILGIWWGIFSVFPGYFGAKFRETRLSGGGYFFGVFRWKFRVGPSQGSVAGRGVLKTRSTWAFRPGFQKCVEQYPDKGRKKHINFSNTNFLPPHPNAPFWAPSQKNLCASCPGKERNKRTHISFFGGLFGSKGGVPNGPLLITQRQFGLLGDFPALIDYTQTDSGDHWISRRINFHYKDRSVGMSAEISHYRCRFSLEFQ